MAAATGTLSAIKMPDMSDSAKARASLMGEIHDKIEIIKQAIEDMKIIPADHTLSKTIILQDGLGPLVRILNDLNAQWTIDFAKERAQLEKDLISKAADIDAAGKTLAQREQSLEARIEACRYQESQSASRWKETEVSREKASIDTTTIFKKMEELASRQEEIVRAEAGLKQQHLEGENLRERLQEKIELHQMEARRLYEEAAKQDTQAMSLQNRDKELGQRERRLARAKGALSRQVGAQMDTIQRTHTECATIMAEAESARAMLVEMRSVSARLEDDTLKFMALIPRAENLAEDAKAELLKVEGMMEEHREQCSAADIKHAETMEGIRATQARLVEHEGKIRDYWDVTCENTRMHQGLTKDLQQSQDTVSHQVEETGTVLATTLNVLSEVKTGLVGKADELVETVRRVADGNRERVESEKRTKAGWDTALQCIMEVTAQMQDVAIQPQSLRFTDGKRVAENDISPTEQPSVKRVRASQVLGDPRNCGDNDDILFSQSDATLSGRRTPALTTQSTLSASTPQHGSLRTSRSQLDTSVRSEMSNSEESGGSYSTHLADNAGEVTETGSLLSGTSNSGLSTASTTACGSSDREAKSIIQQIVTPDTWTDEDCMSLFALLKRNVQFSATRYTTRMVLDRCATSPVSKKNLPRCLHGEFQKKQASWKAGRYDSPCDNCEKNNQSCLYVIYVVGVNSTGKLSDENNKRWQIKQRI